MYDGGKMNIRTVLFTVILILLATAVAGANPSPWPSSENNFTIIQTFEVTFHIEKPLESDSMGAFILYGGPVLSYVWNPAENKGAGFGVELGAELRKYFMQPMSGLFIGGYLGTGALWRSGEENVVTMSTGVKLGWRIPLIKRGLLLDVEPYICVGVKLLGIDENQNAGPFDAAPYLGTKFDFY